MESSFDPKVQRKRDYKANGKRIKIKEIWSDGNTIINLTYSEWFPQNKFTELAF